MGWGSTRAASIPTCEQHRPSLSSGLLGNGLIFNRQVNATNPHIRAFLQLKDRISLRHLPDTIAAFARFEHSESPAGKLGLNPEFRSNNSTNGRHAIR